MNHIDDYLMNVLNKQLIKYEMTDSICEQIISNIRLQMVSLLQYWTDIEFRNTILAIGLEEAMFYKPTAKIEIKCFVVVTIRNSLLETLTSDDYKCLSAKRAITDEEIRTITAGAIEYFSNIDFKLLYDSLNLQNNKNVYKEIEEKYPVAWNAVKAIGNTNKKSVRFNKVKMNFNEDLINIINRDDSTLEANLNKVIMSGYDETLDDNLIKILKLAYTNEGFIFFSGSFKMISRNINKLFCVIDFLLCCRAIVVTANYYITNGYVEIRRPVIKAPHTVSDADEYLNNFKGLSTNHSKAFKQIRNQR